MLRVHLKSEDGRNVSFVSSEATTISEIRREIAVQLGVPVDRDSHLQLNLVTHNLGDGHDEELGRMLPNSGMSTIGHHLHTNVKLLPETNDNSEREMRECTIRCDNCSRYSPKTGMVLHPHYYHCRVYTFGRFPMAAYYLGQLSLPWRQFVAGLHAPMKCHHQVRNHCHHLLFGTTHKCLLLL